MGFKQLANEHKLFRRLILLWAMALITVIVVWTWLSPPDIPTSTAAALGTVTGILTAVIGLYQYLRGKDDDLFKQNKNRDSAGPGD